MDDAKGRLVAYRKQQLSPEGRAAALSQPTKKHEHRKAKEPPPMHVHYALVDTRTGEVTDVLYDLPGAADTLAKPLVVAVQLPGMIRKEDWWMPDPASKTLVKKELIKDIPPRDVTLGEDGILTLQADPGAIAVVQPDQLSAREKDGVIALKFTESGVYFLQITAPGKARHGGRLTVIMLADARKAAKSKVNALRSAQLIKPIDIGGGRLIDGTDASVLSFLIAAQAGQPQNWILADNSVVLLGVGELQTGVQAIAEHRRAAVMAAKGRKDGIADATSVDQIQAISSQPS